MVGSTKFLVDFPVSREFGVETGSQLTASSASQSGLPKLTCEHRSKRRDTAATPIVSRLAASYRWRHSRQHAIESHAATNGGFIPGDRRSRVFSRPHSGTLDIRPAVRCGRERRRKIVVATRAAKRPFQRAQAIG